MVSPGEWITASGEWVNDRTHGQQFKGALHAHLRAVLDRDPTGEYADCCKFMNLQTLAGVPEHQYHRSQFAYDAGLEVQPECNSTGVRLIIRSQAACGDFAPYRKVATAVETADTQQNAGPARFGFQSRSRHLDSRLRSGERLFQIH